jgi:hypothetical protein
MRGPCHSFAFGEPRCVFPRLADARGCPSRGRLCAIPRRRCRTPGRAQNAPAGFPALPGALPLTAFLEILVSPAVVQQALHVNGLVCPTATKTPSERKRQFPQLSNRCLLAVSRRPGLLSKVHDG